jgi:hypothetical protein
VLSVLSREFTAYFKFVVRNVDDIHEIKKIYLPLLPDVDPKMIYISPEGVTAEEIDQVCSVVADEVEKLGFVLGDRRHIRLHGKKRRT